MNCQARVKVGPGQLHVNSRSVNIKVYFKSLRDLDLEEVGGVWRFERRVEKLGGIRRRWEEVRGRVCRRKEEIPGFHPPHNFLRSI